MGCAVRGWSGRAELWHLLAVFTSRPVDGAREPRRRRGCPVAMRNVARVVGALLVVSLVGCSEAPRTPLPVPKSVTKAAEAAAPSDEGLAERYLAAKDRLAALMPEDREGPQRLLTELGPGLREVAEKAAGVALRANASLLLGTLYERAGDPRSAISFYRQTAALIPAEIEPRRVLALALASDGQFVEAIAEQEAVIKDDPDDLEAWLLLGEFNVKAGRGDESAKAYAAYELRRKGLIDGLTLQSKDGTYLMPVDQRAACARALIPARDNGTALALLYALEREPDPSVRQALAEAMGTQRLLGYKEPLTARAAAEAHPEVKAAMVWALQEIERDPLDARPSPLLPADAEPQDPAAKDGAEGTGSKGQGAKDSAAGTGAKGQAGTSSDGARAPTPATP